MRLWHQFLIPYLPTQWLLGQHREITALRGLGWKKPHRTINYVFQFSVERLIAYHYLILNEMKERSIHYDEKWEDCNYHGKRKKQSHYIQLYKIMGIIEWSESHEIPIYPQHTHVFLMRDLVDLTRRISNYNEKRKHRKAHFKPVWFYREPI